MTVSSFQNKQTFKSYGMLIFGRTSSSDSYKYGFNGMEKDDEIKGEGNSLDFGARIYDSRIARFASIDPKFKKYPGINNFNYALNNPILFIDNKGEDAKLKITTNEGGGGSIEITSVVHLYGPNANEDLADQLNSTYSKLGNSGTYTDPQTGAEWKVTINFEYVYNKNLEENSVAMNTPEGELRNFETKPSFIPEGENILYLDNNVPAKGKVHGQGGNTGKVGELSFGNIIHESGHFMGFDERYNLGGIVQVSGDIMAAGTAGERIAPIHFEDVVKFVELSYPYELSLGKEFDKTTHLEPIDNTDDLSPQEMLNSGESDNVTINEKKN